MHEVLVNRLEGLSLPRKSVVRLTDHPDMTFDVYHGRKNQQCNNNNNNELDKILTELYPFLTAMITIEKPCQPISGETLELDF